MILAALQTPESTLVSCLAAADVTTGASVRYLEATKWSPGSYTARTTTGHSLWEDSVHGSVNSYFSSLGCVCSASVKFFDSDESPVAFSSPLFNSVRSMALYPLSSFVRSTVLDVGRSVPVSELEDVKLFRLLLDWNLGDSGSIMLLPETKTFTQFLINL